MDREQQKRMAERGVIQQDEGQGDIEYTIQVSGDRVELHQTYNHEWENEAGTGPDISHEVWTMNKEVFKHLLEAGQWCVEKSEAFEASHPTEAERAEDEESADRAEAEWLDQLDSGELIEDQ